jgi:hypothetical protein
MDPTLVPMLQVVNILANLGTLLVLLTVAIKAGRYVERIEQHDLQIQKLWEAHSKQSEILNQLARSIERYMKNGK